MAVNAPRELEKKYLHGGILTDGAGLGKTPAILRYLLLICYWLVESLGPLKRVPAWMIA